VILFFSMPIFLTCFFSFLSGIGLRRVHEILVVAEAALPAAAAATKGKQAPTTAPSPSPSSSPSSAVSPADPDAALHALLRQHHLNATHLHAKVKKVLGFKRAFGMFDVASAKPTTKPAATSAPASTVSPTTTTKPGGAKTKNAKKAKTTRELLADLRADSLVLLRNVNRTLPLPICGGVAFPSPLLGNCVATSLTSSSPSSSSSASSASASSPPSREPLRVAIVEYVPHASSARALHAAIAAEWGVNVTRRHTVWISHKVSARTLVTLTRKFSLSVSLSLSLTLDLSHSRSLSLSISRFLDI
jgi:hypothetical protein